MKLLNNSIKITARVPTALKNATKRFSSDEVLIRASSLAFSSMLAIVPVGTITISVFSSFPSFHTEVAKIKELIIKTFLPGIGASLEGHLDEFILNASSLSLIGVAGLLISSGLLMYEIHATFNKLFGSFRDVSLREKLLEYWAILTGLPFATISIISITSSLLDKYNLSLGALETFWQSYSLPWFALLILLLLFSPKKTAFLATLIGASIGYLLYIVAQFIFIKYISLPIIPNLIYGALAVVPLLLLWLLVIWTIVIYAATITAELIKDE